MPVMLYMDLRLAPTRSLSQRGFGWLIGFLILFNIAMASFIVVVLRAFPAPIFLAIDVLGLWLAFRVSYRRAGQVEHVQVTADEIRVTHELGARARRVWTSPTAFTRVLVEGADAHETKISLTLSGRSIVVGRALSAPERTAFGADLQEAIRAARAERW